MNSALRLFKKDFYQRIGGLQCFKNKKVLDVGCGDGEDALYISKFAKSVVGLDIQPHKTWEKLKNRNLRFELGVGEKLPFKNNSFDGVFVKDVLHHVDRLDKTLREVRRVVAPGGVVVIIEGNRYNPLFYIHMTKIGGHEHLPQEKFKKVILKYFPNPQFIHFEAHFIPSVSVSFLRFIISIEKIMDKIKILRPILSYNCAIVKK